MRIPTRTHFETGDTPEGEDFEGAFTGLEGEILKAYENQGVWSATQPYAQNDVVTLSGDASMTLWVANDNNTNSMPAQGNADWRVFGGGTATAALQTQIQTLDYSGSGPVVLSDVGHGAHTITPGDTPSAIESMLAAHYSESAANFDVEGTTTAPVPASPASFTFTDGAHNGNYSQNGSPYMGAASYNRSDNAAFIWWNGTNWCVGHISVGGAADATGGTNQADPTAGWPSGVTFTNVVAGSGSPGALSLTIKELTGLNLAPLSSATPNTSFAVTQGGNQASSELASVPTVDELRGVVNGLRPVMPRLVHQVGHGVGNHYAIVPTASDTYAIAGDNVNIVGYVTQVIDADNFIYQPVGPIIPSVGAVLPGAVQYQSGGVSGNVPPTTPGQTYIPYGIAINSHEIVSLAQAPITVPTLPTFATPLTASTTLTATARRVSLDTSSTGQVLTLPSAATLGAALSLEDRELLICNLGSAAWSVACAGSDTYGDGTTTFASNQGDTLRVRPLQRASGTWVNQLLS